MFSNWFRIALLNFLAVAAIGLILRFAFVEELNWMKFRYWLHAHSHVAMLGWIYLGLYTLIVTQLLPAERRRAPFYRQVFWLTQISVAGMLIAFPIQGYGLYSTIFSSLHVVGSYLFIWGAWRDLERASSVAVLFLKTALVFLLMSTLAIWAMPVFVAVGMAGSVWYYMAVQFFLHFQFNGWFLFAVLALLFHHWEQTGASFPRPLVGWFFGLLTAATVFTYALAVAWANPRWEVYLINSTGVALQLAALFFFFALLGNLRGTGSLLPASGTQRLLLLLAFAGFTAKIVIQSAVAIPWVAEAAYTIRNFVIGFIHLILLGVLTFFLLQRALQSGLLPKGNSWIYWGVRTLMLGFILSEGLLFLQGLMFWGARGFLPYYYEALFAVSALLPAGVLLILAARPPVAAIKK